MRSTPSADRVLGRPSHELRPELARRAVAERLVWMDRIVMLKPAVELAQDARRVASRIDPCVVAFERFYKGLGHAVGLRAFDRRCTRLKADLVGQRPSLARGIGRAVVRQPLDYPRQAVYQSEALLD